MISRPPPSHIRQRDRVRLPPAEEDVMALPEVASREEWLRARVDKNYAFEGSQGQVSLADMFGDCSQLVIQHIMFGPDWDSACPRCPQVTSELTDSLTERLRSRDTTYAMVCRAPYAKIDAYRGGRAAKLQLPIRVRAPRRRLVRAAGGQLLPAH